MTQDKFYSYQLSEKRREFEKQLPIEFDRYISYAAYDRGHSCGEDEINVIYCNMAIEFIPLLEEYNKRVGLTK